MVTNRGRFTVPRCFLRTVAIIILNLALFLIPAHADDFTARQIGDYGNVTVMEVSGNFDAYSPDGTLNVLPRQIIAKEFLRTHKDEYDFVAIFTNFDYQRPPNAVAYYSSVKNDVQGIGQEIFDNSSFYGSNGKLQGTIDMWNLLKLVTDPLDPKFNFTVDTLIHETLHRWGAYVHFKDWNGVENKAILGYQDDHWSFLFDSGGSTHLGNKWRDNGDGTFTSTAVRKYYSHLDLYLMGMIDKSKVPPTLLIDNPSIDRERLSELGATISGTAHYVTVDDIIAVEGERIPAAKDSQKQFKTAFVYAVTPGIVNLDDLTALENLRDAYLTRFSILTDGQGLIQVASTPKDDLPDNPGVHPPTTVPRILPPNIDDGVKWLATHQMSDGSWTDFALTTELDTAEAVTTLQSFPAARQQFLAGLQWLGSSASANSDFLARRLEATIQAGGDGSALRSELLSRRNPDGGWGSGQNFISNPTDTALALKALLRAGDGDTQVIGGAVAYLQANQQGDGGWSGDDTVSTIQPTAAVLAAFNSYRKSYPLENSIGRAITFLSGKQNPDGGFGNSPSTVYDSAVAIMALQTAGADKEIVSRGAAYLNGLQTEDGSWQDSPYQTALAVRAVWQTTVDPDLAIKSADISFIPEKVTSLPTNAVVSAVIRNEGRSDVAQAKVAIYDGAVAPEKKVGEQTVALPGMSPETVTFSVPVIDGNGHYFLVVVDPDNLVKEANENNNSAVRALLPESTYDFEVLAADTAVSPNPVDMYQEVRISAKIANRGTVSAYNVPVRFFIDDPGVPFDIATVTVDIPAGGTVVREITWKASRAGVNLPLTVQVNPQETIAETSTSNNMGLTPITVNALVLADPNLTVSYKDIVISPNPVSEGQSVHISAVVRNDGNAEAVDIAVNFYKGEPGAEGILLGSRTISSLKPNESGDVSMDWTNIMETGEKIIYVKADSANAIKELSEDDNSAFATLKILSLPDLAVSTNSIRFTPRAPRDGDTFTIGVTVLNTGDIGVANVSVKTYEEGQLINSQVIPAIAGHSQAMVTFNYDTSGKGGAHQITATVVADNTNERNTDNNSTVGMFTVFKSDLMLSEPFFSPNGDGVKDSTRFSFRFDAPQTVNIDIVNKKGEIVRAFSGGEFTNATSGDITWDGFDGKGRVVDDGGYRIQVKSADGSLLTDVAVVVDNNRSSLVDGILSGNVVSNDLSCMMPSDAFSSGYITYYDYFLRNSVWLPDGSGMMYYVNPHNYWSSQQNAGIYLMEPDGKSIRKVILEDWLTSSQRWIGALVPSPDGSKIVLVTQTGTTDVNYTWEIWAMDADGANLVLLDSKSVDPYAGGSKQYLGGKTFFSDIDFSDVVKWSPDNKTVNYSLISSAEVPAAQKIIAVDIATRDKRIVFTQQSMGYGPRYEWSPRGDYLAVATFDGQTLDWGTWEYISKNTVKVISKDGSEIKTLKNYVDGYSVLDPSDTGKRSFRWLSDTKLLLAASNDSQELILGVVDIGGGAVFNSPPVTDWVISLDNKKLAWFAQHNLQILDVNTSLINTVYLNATYLNQLTYNNKGQFSADSTKFAISAYSSNTGSRDNIIIDINTNNITIIDDKGYNSDYLSTNNLQWSQDSNYLIEEVRLKYLPDLMGPVPMSLYLTEIGSPNKYYIGPGHIIRTEYGSERIFDQFPLNRSIFSYYDNATADGSSGCIIKQGYSGFVFSLWSMSPTTDLKSELVPIRQKSQVLLTGSASDVNFEGYRIEYASYSQPDKWYPIIPYADVPVSSNTFGAWVPPSEGSYYVRLTVWDKAGNVASNRQRVSWGQFSNITDFYKSVEVFSPNGDGIKDAVQLNYRVLEPLHVTVIVYDQNNAPVRTFTRDYAAPATDQISWDGRNESGGVVPDGTYRLRIADYDFFVKVDTSAPEVNLSMSRMDRGPDPKYFDVSLSGHTFDSNIKQWSVEYGEGDNPQQWIAYKSGTGILAARDNSNNVVYPLKDMLVETFSNQKIGWLVGKKFRITAEDYAGKKSSAVTGFVEEKIAIYLWDGNSAPADAIHPDQAKPGVHLIEAVETVRAPLAFVLLQYFDGINWVDAQPGTISGSGVLNISWDNSALNLQKDYQVRIKAKDALGNEFYSNTLKAALSNKQFKIWSLCSEDSANLALVAENPYESLKKLSFQIKSSQDSRYADWTDFGVIEQPQGILLPAGDVIPPRPDIKAGMSYTIRMKGTDAGGATYLSNDVIHPSACAVEIGMEVKNTEADCGKTPGASSLSAQIKKLNAGTKTQSLSYYIQNPQGLQLLRKLDLSREQWDSAVLDTSSLAEGSYQVTAILTFLDPTVNEIKAAEASATVVVDHVAPTSHITYPGASLQLCAAAMPASGGSWFGLPVEGVVADNTKVKRFELLYGVGDNPASWLPAKTRSGNTSADIKGTSAVTGAVGVLDVTDARNTDLSLKLKVVDGAGNASCSTTTFHIKPLPEVRNLAVATPIFSPNGDGVSDRVSASYSVDGSANVETKVFQLNKNVDGSFALAVNTLRTISAAHILPGGMETAEWDGKNDAGVVVADGMYAISVLAKDGCNNTSLKWVAVEVDKTPPVSAISSPKTGDSLGVLVEVRGSVDDLHFKSYLLEAGEGNDPATWITIDRGSGQVKENVLGSWNTLGRQGRWTLRLSSEDSSGNRSSSSIPLDLVVRQTVIKAIDAAPKTISPNSDGKLESSVISYEVANASQVKLEILDDAGAVVREHATVTALAGTFSYAWDARNSSGSIVKDGIYNVRLTVALTANSSASQIETATVVVDTTAPRLEISQPANNAFLNKAQISVSGTVEEQNFASYAVSLTGPSGAVTLDSGSQPRAAYTFGVLNDLAEGSYTLTIMGQDLAENSATISRAFTVDRTAPTTSMASPKSDEYYGSSRNLINILGTVTEANLDRYAVRFGSGASPSSWQELVSGSTLPATSQFCSWKVGKGDDVADGIYTVSLYAKDKAGAEKDVRAKVIVDNTKPTVSITTPLDGGYLKAPFSMYGTVTDTNFDKGTLEMSAGACAGAFKWSAIKTYSLPFQNGLLESWEKLPADGDYCLRVSALDKVGNESNASITIKVDTRPPAVPVLQGALENRAEAALQWTAGSEPDLAGYNLYRGTEKLNSTLLSQISYRDLNLKEGTYSYVVKAVDLAGNESGPSNSVKLVLDFTPPAARIIAPADGARVSGQLDIRGVADSSDDFKQYRIYLGSGANPTAWNLLRTSPVSTSNGVLAQWDAISVAEGSYSIKLEAEDLAGNVNIQRVAVTVDNTAPTKPQLIAATVSGADVSVSWRANSETDVAGYLLYRNDKLANSLGMGGSVKSYLIAGTSYVDKALPDGKYSYYVIAMDQGGNLSDQSNLLTINLDVHPPHAIITNPNSSLNFMDPLSISATSTDNDIASVQFKYKKSVDSSWTNLGSAITLAPYTSMFDPKGLGLPYGWYQIQPVATDNAGKIDPAPVYLQVYYTDLVPPNAPTNLKAATAGKNVTMTWTANSEQDLKGYYVYRKWYGYSELLTYSPITVTTYCDTNVSEDGVYTYEVKAVDSNNNVSPASTSMSVKVYTPLIVQPFTPVGTSAITIQGRGTEPDSIVEIANQTVSGISAPIIAVADNQGNFASRTFNLALGENKITARAIDSFGNVSRTTDPIIIVYNEPPTSPTGLVTTAQSNNVDLSWNANQEQDLLGYNLYRDGEKINKSLPVTQGQSIASSYDSDCNYYYYCYSQPSINAFDGNPNTYWASAKGYSTNFGPEYWQLQLPASELISRMQIDWGVTADASGKEVLYGGKDFEVQAWTGNTWVTLTKVTGNTVKTNALEFKPSYATSKIRIYVTATNDPNATSRQVRIADVKLFKDGLIKTTAFQDSNLKDHKYLYSITAVDKYGFESGRSAEAMATVGDVIPPATPSGLTASASGSTVILAWMPVSSETDLAGYNVYRSTGQSWEKLNAAVVPAASYTEVNLKNGCYSYRVTALDLVGNESAPSGEAVATVSAALPATPANLRVTVVPQGTALKVEWDTAVGSAASSSLYRSTTAGGPYAKIVSLPGSSNFFIDSGLSNGSAYYYVVTSVDSQENESIPSSEVSGMAADSVPPAIPAISFPTSSGNRAFTYDGTTDIAGMAEPGVNIELLKGGISLGSTTPVETVDAMKLSLDYSGSYATVSPGGHTLAYMSNSSQLVLQELSGATKTVASYGYSSVWNSAGTKLAYTYRDNNWQYRIGLYDLATGTSSQVTTDTYTNESSPSWSDDGKKLAFINSGRGSSDVYLKDLEAGSLTKLTNWINASNPKVSPDGTAVAYFEYSTLKSVDSSTGTVTQIDTNAVSNSKIGWSPDGKKLAFISIRNGYQNLYSFDTSTKTVTALTKTTNGKPGPVAWSPDGGSVVYIRSESDGTTALWLADTSGNNRPVLQKLSGVTELKWKKNGELLYVNGYGVHTVFLGSHFIFKGIALDIGENLFNTRASDPYGNVSDSSDEIRVTYDTSKVPDASATADDIFVYPLFPKPGEEVVVNVLVRNNRNVSMQNVDVDIYAWDTAGDLELLKSQTITNLPANYVTEFSTSLNAGSRIGAESIIVVVDGENKINELNEDNNYASAEFYVTDREEVVVTASTDGAEYAGNSEAVMTITVGNSGAVREGVLTVGVEDTDGNSVAILRTAALAVPYGEGERYTYNWNTGSTFAGSYRVHAVFTASDGTVTESSTPFAILPDIRIESGVVTDRQGYGASDNVAVILSLKNSGSNYLVPQLKASVRIVDSHDATLFSDEKTVRNLFPAMESSLSVQWNTGLNLPGDYRAVVETYLDDKLVSSGLARFVINPVSRVSGTVTVDPAVVLIGSNLRAVFTLANSGNIGANGSIKAVIVSSESGAIIATAEQPVALATNGSQAGEFVFPTAGLELKSYLVSLQYSSLGIQKSIAGDSFTVKDGTPPTVTVVSPLGGSSYNATVPIAILASDNASGVERVEYQVDGGAWKSLPLADPAHGRYAAAWEPTIADNGLHTVSFRAADRAGNMGMAVSVGIDIQMDSIPPVTVIGVGTPRYETSDKLYVSSATLFTLTASDDYSGVARTEYRIDDGQWLPYAPFALAGEGEHLLYCRSIDGAGNLENEKFQKVIVDRTPPRTVLAASDLLMEGVENTVSPDTIFTITASDGISGVKGVWYRIDSGPWQLFTEGFTLSGLAAGSHTVSVSAADNVGNEEAERAITVRLVLAEVKKEISLDLVVLVGAWEDGANKVKNRSAIDALQQILSSRGISHHIAENGEDFKLLFRSGRYNTYLLVDYRDEKVGAELREAVNRGDSLVFMKTRPSVDAYMHEVFGVKLTGRTTSDNLPVHLAESPIGGGETLQSGGKQVVIGEILADTVQVFGQVEDKRNLYPALVYNEYGNGKVILYTFDLLGCPEKEKVGDLLGSSLMLLKPEEHTVRALDTLPVRITVSGSAEPIALLVRETIPVGSAADSIVPHCTATGTTITWLQEMGVSSVADFAYYLNLPDVAGEYTFATDIMYANHADYRTYDTAGLTATVQKSSADLLRESIAELSNLPVASSNDLAILSDSLNRLSRITTDPAGLKDAEKGIDDVIAVIRLIGKLSADVTGIRLKLDELLKILERKWYLVTVREEID